MEIENLLSVTTREEMRDWLSKNNTSEKFCWVIVSIKPETGKVRYLDAVEEALCFGWIDGIKKSISKTQTAQRFSPRTKNSPWTELNKERVRRLEKLGFMTDAGRKILPDMSVDSFEIDAIIEEKLKEDKETYANFLAFPSLYQRIRIDNIQRVKKSEELFESRLIKFVDSTKQNKMYGAWNDEERLIDY